MCKQNLALNNIQELICHKPTNEQTNQQINQLMHLFPVSIFFLLFVLLQ